MHSLGTFRRVVAFFVLVVIAQPVGAAVLANKALSQIEFGWNSNINGGSQQSADNLNLAVAGTANQLTWYGFRHDGAPSANFQVRIFQHNVNQPAAVPFYDQALGLLNGVDTGLDNQFGNSIFEYTSAIPAVALNAGTQYWLTIASSDPPTWAWSHAAIGPPGNDQFHRDGDAGAWRSLLQLGFPADRLEQAFRLEGIVPEPASIAIAGPLLSLVALRRRRR